MGHESNRLIHGDCLRELKRLRTRSVHLVFADPPYNIGYQYDEYSDNRSADEYVGWSREWMAEVARVLRNDGAFWLAIGDEYAAELKVTATRELGLTCRNWVIWYYTFGVHCKNKFTRSHAHLLYFVADPTKFTFNDKAIRVPSARQLVYGDKRANPAGRLPDDTWVIRPTPEDGWILRPQDLPEGFTGESDTWYFPRVCGTFKERGGFHGCQMPEQLLGRVLLACSNVGDLVLDPFAGTGTTLAVAKKLDRRYVGIELSREYTANARRRLHQVRRGDPLAGSDNPVMSAPRTRDGVVLTRDHKRARRNWRNDHAVTNGANRSPSRASTAQNKSRKRRIKGLDRVNRAIIGAFERSHGGWSTDRVVTDPAINEAFLAACRERSLPGTSTDWNLALLRLRKTKCLSHLRPMTATRIAPEELDQCDFASEIAMAILTAKHQTALDTLLCNPDWAAEFDSIARRLAPGWPVLHYRWGALRIRKRRNQIVAAGEGLDHPLTSVRFGRRRPLSVEGLPTSPGVYLLAGKPDQPLYVGATENVRRRIDAHLKGEVNADGSICDSDREGILLRLPANKWAPWLEDRKRLHGFQSRQIGLLKPRWNFQELGIDAA